MAIHTDNENTSSAPLQQKKSAVRYKNMLYGAAIGTISGTLSAATFLLEIPFAGNIISYFLEPSMRSQLAQDIAEDNDLDTKQVQYYARCASWISYLLTYAALYPEKCAIFRNQSRATLKVTKTYQFVTPNGTPYIFV